MSFQNKNILICGGASGIGLASAELFLSRSNPSSVGTHTRVYSLIVFLILIYTPTGVMGASGKSS